VSTAVTTSDWISYRQAQKTLALSYEGVLRLINAGCLSVRELPGAHPRVRRSEVEALAARYTKVARPEVETSRV
jgi:hypothetical protein